MTGLAAALISYDDFVKLQDPENGKRYELHDGEVVLVPPARPVHLVLQMRLLEMLRVVEDRGFGVVMEFPYRPAPRYQFWYADVAIVSRSIQAEMVVWTDYRPYAPDLVVEVKSASNTEMKLGKQRIASMSNGTREFWFIDGEKKTIQVTNESDARTYGAGESIEVLGLARFIHVDAVFAGI
ncbi:MAG: Uma2 family endonuclease [Prolixibacteraceae bacterium]|nr:Uma2 family endonuclease [Burkholderiales bacterium]